MTRTAVSSAATAACLWFSLAVAPAQVCTDCVVISQVYGGGGNTGAALRNDFIEIFNRGAEPVDLSGWSVQYASAAGAKWQRTGLAGVLAPGRYYLIVEGGAGGGTEELPAADARGGVSLAATSGKVALVSHRSLLRHAAPGPAEGVIDLVGFGAATWFEGAGAAPLAGNTTALARAWAGCLDSNHNAADFVKVSAIVARNSAIEPRVCVAAPLISSGPWSPRAAYSSMFGAFWLPAVRSGPDRSPRARP